jgi:metal-responsive CopG/Arc/MetJ family transcriptional regulator
MSNDSAKKSSRGRPPVDTEAVNVRLPREMIEAIDAYRRAEEDLPTRPEAIRRLVEKALEK